MKYPTHERSKQMETFTEGEIRVASSAIYLASYSVFPTDKSVAIMVETALYRHLSPALPMYQAISRSKYVAGQFARFLEELGGDRSQFAPDADFVRALMQTVA